jgi:hypothetical protein
MEVDRALELAVVASWDEIVDRGESCSLHVEYGDIQQRPLSALEVWKIKNRGYGTLVYRYAAEGLNLPGSRPEAAPVLLANSRRSHTLADNLDFIMRNQREYSRPTGRSIHGLVRIDRPNEDERKSAAAWSGQRR